MALDGNDNDIGSHKKYENKGQNKCENDGTDKDDNVGYSKSNSNSNDTYDIRTNGNNAKSVNTDYSIY